MRLIKLILLTTVLLGAAQSALAACQRSGAGTNQSLTWGTKKTDINTPVGSSLTPNQLTFDVKNGVVATGGCSGSFKLTGGFTPNANFDTVTKTYPTGVKGIGVRLTVIKGNESYILGDGPMGFDITATSAGRVSLSGYKIKADLIKTSTVQEAGPLTGLMGVEANLYLEGFEDQNPIFHFTFNEAALNIITNPSCSLLSKDGRNLTVTLPPVKLASFKNIGSVAGETNANFKLKCEGGYENITTQVFTEFKSATGEYGGEYGADIGVLANESDDKQSAKNIGIQVLIDNNPVLFEADEEYGKFTGVEGSLDYKMTARYYQYGNNPTGGKVLSRMIYTLSYQ